MHKETAREFVEIVAKTPELLAIIEDALAERAFKRAMHPANTKPGDWRQAEER